MVETGNSLLHLDIACFEAMELVSLITNDVAPFEIYDVRIWILPRLCQQFYFSLKDYLSVSIRKFDFFDAFYFFSFFVNRFIDGIIALGYEPGDVIVFV